MGLMRAFRDDDSGVTSIEYALIALLIGVALVPALSLLAPELNNTFGTVDSNL